MTVTKYLPLDSTDYWLGTTFIYASVLLLRDDVTAADINDAWRYPNEFRALEIPDGGGYFSGSGINMPPLTRVNNVAAGVTEYDVGAATWSSASQSGSYTVSNFRWLLIYDAPPLGLWDLGASHHLSNQPLVLDVARSPYSTGVHPILSFKKNVT